VRMSMFRLWTADEALSLSYPANFANLIALEVACTIGSRLQSFSANKR